MEDAGGFAPRGVLEVVRDRKESVFAEERFELSDDGGEGNQIDCGHAALDKEAGEPDVAEIRV